MKEKIKRPAAADLERVIAKNRERISAASQELREALIKAGLEATVTRESLQEALGLYRDLRTRLLEIESVQRLLSRRTGRPAPRDLEREKMIVDLDVQIHDLCSRIGATESGLGNDCVKKVQQTAGQTVVPSDQWLNKAEDSVAFTANLRLLNELDYRAPDGPAAAGGGKEKDRKVEQAGRSFTLFSIRGPAAALDAILPSIQFREHDIVERFGAYEVRGVLTHLCPTTNADIQKVIARLLSAQFPEVKCILISIQSPENLDDKLLDLLERTAGEMRAGEMKMLDLTK